MHSEKSHRHTGNPSSIKAAELHPNARLRKDLREASHGKGVKAFSRKREFFDSLRSS